MTREQSNCELQMEGSLLLIGDEVSNGEELVQGLVHQGFTLRVAQHGREAIELLESESFDLVLLDFMRPDMNGLDVLKGIRLSHSAVELPVIIVTTGNQGEGIVDALKFGANDYLTKPVELHVVLARIQVQLSRKRAEEALRESEERYALTALASKDGLWEWNLKNNQAYYSPRWKAMIGCSESEIGRGIEEWFQRIHPNDLEKVKAGIAAHLAGHTPQFEIEHRMLDEHGTYRWMCCRGLAMRDAHGRATRMAGSQTDVTEVKQVDALTGLPNRILFMDRLGRSLERTRRHSNYLFAILFLDLDRFKLVIDSLGHVIGDQFLVAIAGRLMECLRPGDSVARFGGDEFAILVDDIKHVSDVTRVADRIRESLNYPFNLEGQEAFTTASIGIALSATGYDRPEDLLRDAETAMYRAKSSGRAHYEVFDGKMRARALERVQLESDLRRAIEREEFCNYYQPIIALQTGKIVGFEALVRWRHPARGLVSPADFIPFAEETGIIILIGQWVLREACRQMGEWKRKYPGDQPLTISVNLSSKQLTHPGLIEQADQILREAGLEASRLKLEITESVIMEAESATAILVQLRFLDVHLSIDDFGTGYSSLSYLHRFPVETLKIDRSFVSGMGPDADKLEFVRTIVTLAHNLDMDVIAEGVETAEQAEKLKLLGCEYGQGYYFSRPVDKETAEKLVAAQARESLCNEALRSA